MGRFSRMTCGLAAVAAAVGISGAGAQAQPVTLDVFYAQPSFAKYHEPIAQAFMKAHPEIKIAFRAPAAMRPARRRAAGPGPGSASA